ncbi:MAG: metallophosphoesterase [Thermaurantiacus sp.]
MLLAALLAPDAGRAQMVAAPAVVVDARGPEPAPHAPGQPHAARNLPDRIVLVPGADPAREMIVSWRTDVNQPAATLELVEMVNAPNFALRARQLGGVSTRVVTENGDALHHRASLVGLVPDTAYGYRVKGAGGWSEWHQFRTPPADRRPVRFLYFGDTQNSILSVGSLAWRRAILQAGDPAFIVHAGDLVASRAEMVHDDEWGEWAAAGGWVLASIPQLAAVGNHEYVDARLPDGSGSRRLGGHWALTFPFPGNGAEGVETTTKVVDWQGVRFIVLDGTSALDLGTLDAQTRWLEEQLKRPKLDWTVVVMHQPIFTCSRAEDTRDIGPAWRPLFERHRVDLVLQGHDHCYHRLTSPDGRDAGMRARARGAAQGPVYLISVTGSKMYELHDRSLGQADRVAEDTRLFQIVDASSDRLSVRAHLATGELYDSFDITRQRNGSNRLVEQMRGLPPARRCSGPGEADLNADGLPCTVRRR